MTVLGIRRRDDTDIHNTNFFNLKVPDPGRGRFGFERKPDPNRSNAFLGRCRGASPRCGYGRPLPTKTTWKYSSYRVLYCIIIVDVVECNVWCQRRQMKIVMSMATFEI